MKTETHRCHTHNQYLHGLPCHTCLKEAKECSSTT